MSDNIHDKKQSIRVESEQQNLIRETAEGSQELASVQATNADELGYEYGATLRLPEGLELDPGDMNIEISPDEKMIINMGPPASLHPWSLADNDGA